MFVSIAQDVLANGASYPDEPRRMSNWSDLYAVNHTGEEFLWTHVYLMNPRLTFGADVVF